MAVNTHAFQRRQCANVNVGPSLGMQRSFRIARVQSRDLVPVVEPDVRYGCLVVFFNTRFAVFLLSCQERRMELLAEEYCHPRSCSTKQVHVPFRVKYSRGDQNSYFYLGWEHQLVGLSNMQNIEVIKRVIAHASCISHLVRTTS
jgi:hypothetical protein